MAAAAHEPWEAGPPPGRFDDEAPRSSSVPVLDGAAIGAALGPLEYLVHEIGLVAGGGAPHLLAGYGFAGKTLAAQALGLALAAGAKAWGAHVVHPRRVLHVDLEQGERLSRRRYQRLAAAMSLDLPEIGDAIGLAVMPPVSLVAAHAEAWRSLMAGRDLMILDSLRAATAGADENDSSIRAALDLLGQLAEETGCRSLVIHHARKPSGDDPGGRYAIRGSSAIYDACDSVYVFSAGPREPITAEMVKARTHGEPVSPWALVIEDVEIDGDPRAGLAVQVRGVELVARQREERAAAARKVQVRRDAETVRTTIAARPGLGTRELRAAVGLSGDRLADAIAHLGDAVAVRDEVNGRARKTRHYLRGAQ